MYLILVFFMLKKREIVASLVTYSGMIVPLRWLSRRHVSIIPILTYHGVSNDPAESFIDDGLVAPPVQTFEKQMDYMKRHYHVITFHEFFQIINNNQSELLDGRKAIITFDDGYKNNYDVVFPILKKRDLRATVFLVTDCIEEGEMFWFEKISFLIKRTKKERLTLRTIPGKRWSIRRAKERLAAIRDIKRICKEVEDTERICILNELCESLGFETLKKGAPRIVLSWNEVIEMSEYGIEFGSHTLSHPVLTRLDDRRLEAELAESKKSIEEKIGQEVVSFAYPGGTHNQRVQEAVKKAGYSFGLAYNHGLFHYPPASFYNIDRVLVEGEFSLPLFKLHLLTPNIRLGEVFFRGIHS